MRQAGLKPKNHSSGVYWIRASKDNQGPDTEKNSLGFVLWSVIKMLNGILFMVDRLKKLLTLK